MYESLKTPRSTYYYEAKKPLNESKLTKAITEIFRICRNYYGTRKIKYELATWDIIVSRHRIGRITRQGELVSTYTTAQFRPHKDTCNESKVDIIVSHHFDKQTYRNVVVSNFTYVRVGMSWDYICVLVDLFNREIIGHSTEAHKTAVLVKRVFQSIR